MPAHQRFPDFREDQREFFDALIVEDWDTYRSADWDFVRRYEVQKIFSAVQPKTILDVGCGCGFHDVEMAQFDFVTRVDAIDNSQQSIAKAEEHYGHLKVRRWVAALDEIPLTSRYDLVVSFQVIEHLSKPVEFLTRCAAICAEGGHVAVATPNRRRLGNILRSLSGKSPTMLDPQHFQEYSSAEMDSLAAQSGLVPVTHFGYGMHGIRAIDRMPVEWRTRLGSALPFAAHQFCAIYSKTAS